MKQVIMLSGLPRSGSTVLTSLLNQHPSIRATTTSPVADLVTQVSDSWPNISRAIVNPSPQQYGNIIDGIISGAHQHEERPIVVDKNRLWPRLASHLHKHMQHRWKIICTVRDIDAIMASYILLINKNLPNTNFIDDDLRNNNYPVNNKNRCRILMEKYIGHPYNSLKIGYNSGAADLLWIDYKEIVDKPQVTVDRICQFINISTHVIDPTNLDAMPENDEYHGGLVGLHDIRSSLSKISPSPEVVLGKEICEYYRNMKLHFWQS